MTCSKCGATAAEGAPFCSTCGAGLSPGGVPIVPLAVAQERTSGMAIAGFVLAFFCSLLGLIFSIMGRSECKRSGGTIKGEGLALAGIIISTISMALGVLGVLAAIAIPAFLSYNVKGKTSEAQVQLRQLERRIKTTWLENAKLPTGITPITPTESCCNGPGAKCSSAENEWTKDPIWRELDFQIYDSHRFRYQYESDGRSFSVRAIGDLDCDGVEITYELQGRVVDGSIVTDPIIDPPPNSD